MTKRKLSGVTVAVIALLISLFSGVTRATADPPPPTWCSSTRVAEGITVKACIYRIGSMVYAEGYLLTNSAADPRYQLLRLDCQILNDTGSNVAHAGRSCGPVGMPFYSSHPHYAAIAKEYLNFEDQRTGERCIGCYSPSARIDHTW